MWERGFFSLLSVYIAIYSAHSFLHHQSNPIQSNTLPFTQSPPLKMKFTVSSVLVAALATLSSAAVIPSAAAATALPQKFTLVVSPSTSGTPLDTESTQITVDANFPRKPASPHAISSCPTDPSRTLQPRPLAIHASQRRRFVSFSPLETR